MVKVDDYGAEDPSSNLVIKQFFLDFLHPI